MYVPQFDLYLTLRFKLILFVAHLLCYLPRINVLVCWQIFSVYFYYYFSFSKVAERKQQAMTRSSYFFLLLLLFYNIYIVRFSFFFFWISHELNGMQQIFSLLKYPRNLIILHRKKRLKLHTGTGESRCGSCMEINDRKTVWSASFYLLFLTFSVVTWLQAYFYSRKVSCPNDKHKIYVRLIRTEVIIWSFFMGVIFENLEKTYRI